MLREREEWRVTAHESAASLQTAIGEREDLLGLVLLDGDDPDVGLAAVGVLRQLYPRVRLLLLCEEISKPVLRCVLEQRLEGVVLKSDGIEDLIAAIRHVLEGRSVMPSALHAPGANREARELAALSRRENEILTHLAEGMTNREIAQRLVISPNTVKFHLRSIYLKLGVANRVEASQRLAD
jgi:DNA-binding NarL/FixJ family response regulator